MKTVFTMEVELENGRLLNKDGLAFQPGSKVPITFQYSGLTMAMEFCWKPGRTAEGKDPLVMVFEAGADKPHVRHLRDGDDVYTLKVMDDEGITKVSVASESYLTQRKAMAIENRKIEFGMRDGLNTAVLAAGVRKLGIEPSQRLIAQVKNLDGLPVEVARAKEIPATPGLAVISSITDGRVIDGKLTGATFVASYRLFVKDGVRQVWLESVKYTHKLACSAFDKAVEALVGAKESGKVPEPQVA
jgi:hypothetical protein